MIYYVFPLISSYFFSSSLNYIKDNIKERYPLKNLYLAVLSLPVFFFYSFSINIYDIFFSLSCLLAELFLLFNLKKLSQGMTFFFISLKSLILIFFDLYANSFEYLLIFIPILFFIMFINKEYLYFFLFISFFFDALSLILCQKMKTETIQIQAIKNVLLGCLCLPFVKRIYFHHQYFYSFFSSTLYFYPLKYVLLSVYSLMDFCLPYVGIFQDIYINKSTVSRKVLFNVFFSTLMFFILALLFLLKFTKE